MPKFFMPVPDGATEITVTGEDAHHIGYALRSKVGDVLTICNTDQNAQTCGFDYTCHISAFDAQTVTLAVDSCAKSDAEPTVSITLYQAVPKNDKLDSIVQKSVELGVTAIVPVLTKRCISRPDAKSQVKKRERLQKIASEAAKQCGRNLLPEVRDFCSFKEALSDCQNADCKIICYEGGGIRLCDAYRDSHTSIALFVGSEGGFEEQEVRQAEQAGVVSCTLGKLILRCETAPITAISVLRSLTGDI